jgi:hypothetical protein
VIEGRGRSIKVKRRFCIFTKKAALLLILSFSCDFYSFHIDKFLQLNLSVEGIISEL